MFEAVTRSREEGPQWRLVISSGLRTLLAG